MSDRWHESVLLWPPTASPVYFILLQLVSRATTGTSPSGGVGNNPPRTISLPSSLCAQKPPVLSPSSFVAASLTACAAAGLVGKRVDRNTVCASSASLA